MENESIKPLTVEQIKDIADSIKSSHINMASGPWDNYDYGAGYSSTQDIAISDLDTIPLSGINTISNLGSGDFIFSGGGGSMGSISMPMAGQIHTITTGGTGGANSINNYTGVLHSNTISTSKNSINIDELAELIKVLKSRLLILVPNFEKHEKYPMLKQMYDEYKAMEALLNGPDLTGEENG